jgi:hypothetical protein
MSKAKLTPSQLKAKRREADAKAHRDAYKRKKALKVKALKAEGKAAPKKSQFKTKKDYKNSTDQDSAKTGPESVVNLPSLLPVLVHNKINLPEAVKLRAEGSKLEVIAQKYGVTGSALRAAITKYTKAAREIDTFRSNRADIIAELQKMLLSSIDLKAIQKASLQQKVLAFAVLYDKERLELDKSTANIDVLHNQIAQIKHDEGN